MGHDQRDQVRVALQKAEPFSQLAKHLFNLATADGANLLPKGGWTLLLVAPIQRDLCRIYELRHANLLK